MNLKKNGKVFTSNFVRTGPSSYEKIIYWAAVPQRLRNTALKNSDRLAGPPRRLSCVMPSSAETENECSYKFIISSYVFLALGGIKFLRPCNKLCILHIAKCKMFLSYPNWWPTGNSLFSSEHKAKETLLPLPLVLALYAFFSTQNAWNTKPTNDVTELTWTNNTYFTTHLDQLFVFSDL